MMRRLCHTFVALVLASGRGQGASYAIGGVLPKSAVATLFNRCRNGNCNNINIDAIGNSDLTSSVDYIPIGLKNLGNTCYFNSVLQVLYHSSPLFLAAIKDARYDEVSAGIELQSLFRKMNESRIMPVSPIAVLQRMAAPIRTQEDAQEYLLRLLDEVNNYSHVFLFIIDAIYPCWITS
jgi:uncharacterized UBP type Zn finger protein